MQDSLYVSVTSVWNQLKRKKIPNSITQISHLNVLHVNFDQKRKAIAVWCMVIRPLCFVNVTLIILKIMK